MSLDVWTHGCIADAEHSLRQLRCPWVPAHRLVYDPDRVWVNPIWNVLELARVVEELGLDVRDVARGLADHPETLAERGRVDRVALWETKTIKSHDQLDGTKNSTQ